MSKFYDSFQLAQRIAVVTGGAGLLGSEFCRILARAGASVVVADIDEEGAKLVVGEIQDEGFLAIPEYPPACCGVIYLYARHGR